MIIVVLNVVLILCMFVMGSLFGSFFSLATYRLPRKQDIIATRSYCPNCKHRLNFLDLIPVFSYLFRGAKCKYCSNPISPRYFIFEVINGILFVILYLLFGYSLKLALVVLVYAILFVLIGSYIMKSKMSVEEIKEVDKMLKENKKINKSNLSKKSGVFISELVIALVLFIITFVTIVIINKNTRIKINSLLAESYANTLLQKNMEICMLAKYDELNSFNFSTNNNGISYNVSAEVSSLYNNSYKKDIIKKIDIVVSYNINGEYKELENSTLKGKI